MKDITKLPPKPKIDAAEIKAPKRQEVTTLHSVLTEGETKNYMFDFIRDMSTRKGPWGAYWEFFKANHTGDMSSMTKETRAYVEKMLSDLKEKYAEEMK